MAVAECLCTGYKSKKICGMQGMKNAIVEKGGDVGRVGEVGRVGGCMFVFGCLREQPEQARTKCDLCRPEKSLHF